MIVRDGGGGLVIRFFFFFIPFFAFLGFVIFFQLGNAILSKEEIDSLLSP